VPEIPEPVRGQSFAVVEIVSLLDQIATDEVLAPLRKLDPLMDTVRPTSAVELAAIHMDPPAPAPAAGDGFLLTDLPADALDAFLSVAGPEADFPVLGTEIRHLGGALAPDPAKGGAVTGFAAGYALFSASLTLDEASFAAANVHLDRLRDTLRDWTAPTSYLNFAERPGNGPFADAATLDRLRQVKAQYDPTDLVRGNHPVAPARG
jgi:hypothetical protein